MAGLRVLKRVPMTRLDVMDDTICCLDTDFMLDFQGMQADSYCTCGAMTNMGCDQFVIWSVPEYWWCHLCARKIIVRNHYC